MAVMNNPTSNDPIKQVPMDVIQVTPKLLRVEYKYIKSATINPVKTKTIPAVIYLISGCLPNAPNTNPATNAPAKI